MSVKSVIACRLVKSTLKGTRKKWILQNEKIFVMAETVGITGFALYIYINITILYK